MLFNSLEYLLLFLPIVFTIYFLFSKFKLFKTAVFFLLFASLFFYGTYKIDYVYIILVSILFNYGISCVFRTNIKDIFKKSVLTFGIIGNVGILVGFKYFDFLAETFSKISFIPFNTMEVVLPLGISFFTLQQISYIVDCYKKDIEKYNLLDYALFVCFFPQLVAGPIVRHEEMIPQFRNVQNRFVNQDNIFVGIFLLTVGLLKKVLLADNFADFISRTIEYNLYNDFYISWFLGFAKVMQGYFDFSGYCDIALGSAFLFNIVLPWNFNSPYKAVSILDYWSRWHMTLVRFLKDYIFIPLGGNTKGLFRSCINVMIVFFVYGCWKGSNPVNLIYGILNGVLVCINKIWNKFNINMPRIMAITITFTTLMLLTCFISIDNFNQAFAILKPMFGIGCEFNPITISGFNLKFYPVFPPLELNLFLLISCIYIAFFSKNSTELAQVYIKSNNTFYTIILDIIFVITVLSITRSKEFLYFLF